MKKLIWMMIVAMSVMACSKDEDEAAKQAAIDDELIRTYLEDNSLTATKDASGLYYKILKQGSGMFSPSASLRIRYTGKLLDGTKFDSGTIDGPLSRYIKGWQIGIPKLSIGGKAILYIPSALGYGSRSSGGIPANSVLIFDVEVLSVN